MTPERAKEMLELAAKALGGELDIPYQDGTHDLVTKKCVGEVISLYWNPLTNSTDCAEMEAHLKIDIEWGESFVIVKHDERMSIELYSNHDSPQSARMLAVTKVAAEIGRRMSDDK